ncbi:MAG TPA: glutathione S-transferase family protein [Steroidobacteraceae bacterium]|jgi:glutathione S-transferase|nr:glutathione S-transferase family protein [Steroidobacteraceae bacterium]HNS28280.1 glutathione S-transferase family protein [Steroidobacteraceae bacterium]
MIDLYWGSGSPYCWRVLLALEHKRLEYVSHQLQFSRQEHKAPHIVAMNPRGRLPILKHDDYVVFESVAVLHYLDLKYPEPPIFGRTPEEAGVIVRVICEFEAYAQEHLAKITRALFGAGVGEDNVGELTRAMLVVASEARTIEGRLSKGDWIVGDAYSAADMVIYPAIMVLLRALQRPGAEVLASRFMPVAVNYPSLARWLDRVAALPGYEKTYPPHWLASARHG